MVGFPLSLPVAIELLAKPANELALGPIQPLIVDRYGQQSLLAPSILLDLLGRSARSTEPWGCPPHRVTSGSNAA